MPQQRDEDSAVRDMRLSASGTIICIRNTDHQERRLAQTVGL